MKSQDQKLMIIFLFKVMLNVVDKHPDMNCNKESVTVAQLKISSKESAKMIYDVMFYK